MDVLLNFNFFGRLHVCMAKYVPVDIILTEGKTLNHKTHWSREGKCKARVNTNNIEDFVKMTNQKIVSVTLSHEAFVSDTRHKFVPANTIVQ